IRAKRQLELESANFDLEPKHKRNLYFFDYFEAWVKSYNNKDVRLAKACFKYFLRFLEEEGLSKKLTTNSVTKELVKRFREFLDHSLNGETPYNYFNKFVKLCNDA
ncbi:phage integrase SAM-like domain-containing protein, partial [Arthrospira platensis SPKY1]|nr:phage integrase SAM-like domain-containing protein [Arthrospira platensis SPKY1]